MSGGRGKVRNKTWPSSGGADRLTPGETCAVLGEFGAQSLRMRCISFSLLNEPSCIQALQVTVDSLVLTNRPAELESLDSMVITPGLTTADNGTGGPAFVVRVCRKYDQAGRCPGRQRQPHSSAIPSLAFTAIPCPASTAIPCPTSTAIPCQISTANPCPFSTAISCPTSTAIPCPASTAVPCPASTAVPCPASTTIPSKASTAIPSPASTAIPCPAFTTIPCPTSTVIPCPPSTSAPCPASTAVPHQYSTAIPSPLSF
ncbi:hypothetical protein J6590_012008 [Homalodisca vitripennis]|nr:hypothetical protein J6590_012008 [Homalodisca vitripennis]